jgi:hypothetical protein
VDLALRYPATDFVMGHCGATDFWNDVTNSASAAPNIYLESSLARPFLFANYLGVVGADRGIMGSWAPLNDLELEWEQMRKFLPADAFRMAAGANIVRLESEVRCDYRLPHALGPCLGGQGRCQWLSVLDRHGISKAVLMGHANLVRSDACARDNDTVARLARQFPERFVPSPRPGRS